MNNNENINQNPIPSIGSNPINNTPNIPQVPIMPNTPTQVTTQPVTQAPTQMQQTVSNVQPVTISQSQQQVQATNIIPTQPQPVQVTPVTNQVSTTNSSNNTNIQSSVVEEINTPANGEDMSDVADITFDYNQIYGVQNNAEKEEDNIDVVEKQMFTAQDVEIKVNDLQGRTSTDIVPEFNINALNNNVNKEDAKLSDNVLSDKQQEKQETRRAIIWIVVLVLILVIFVGFIFPIINGYKF